jgi:hypothetical protein
MLWIRDILVRIRIRVAASLTYGSGSGYPDPAFLSVEVPTKNEFLCFYYFFESTFSSVFLDKKSKRSHKIEEIKVFLIFFTCRWKDLDPDSYKIMTDPDPDP